MWLVWDFSYTMVVRSSLIASVTKSECSTADLWLAWKNCVGTLTRGNLYPSWIQSITGEGVCRTSTQKPVAAFSLLISDPLVHCLYFAIFPNTFEVEGHTRITCLAHEHQNILPLRCQFLLCQMFFPDLTQ